MSKDRYDVYEERNSQKGSSGGRSHKRKKKKRSLKAKFFMVLSLVLFVYCVGALAYFGYEYYTEDSTSVSNDSDYESASFLDSIVKPKLKERTVFAILGVDKDGDRTDTIMLCCYNQPLDELTIISVPRDTIVQVSEEAFEQLSEEYPEPGQRGMKINAITHYGLEKYGLPILFSELEEFTGLPIDYYCVVRFEALRYLVDAMGGIEYDVPMQMDYDDPSQDLAIHLKPGLQVLDGESAEGLVRFRYGYDNQDIDRVATQQNFCKELLKQLVSKDNMFKNAKAYLSTFFNYVDTNVGLTDAIKYMSVIKDFNTDNIYTYTMPGDASLSLYGITGGWVLNEEEAKSLCYDVFQKPVEEIKAERAAAAQEAAANGETPTVSYNDKELTIQVLNGGYTNGMASSVQNELLNAGYNVKSIGTYTGDKTDNTRIYVKSEGMGESVKSLFSNAEVIVDATQAGEYDIVVVIGINEE